jgi:hypothetical protein
MVQAIFHIYRVLLLTAGRQGQSVYLKKLFFFLSESQAMDDKDKGKRVRLRVSIRSYNFFECPLTS